MFDSQLRPMFDGCAMLNGNATHDLAVIKMLEDQKAKGWPICSGFGSHVTVQELINEQLPAHRRS